MSSDWHGTHCGGGDVIETVSCLQKATSRNQEVRRRQFSLGFAKQEVTPVYNLSLELSMIELELID